MTNAMKFVNLIRDLESPVIPKEEKLKEIKSARDFGIITPDDAIELAIEYFSGDKGVTELLIPDPDHRIYAIGEVIFDMMDYLCYKKRYFEFLDSNAFEGDSRLAYQTLLNWAYEFEAKWRLKEDSIEEPIYYEEIEAFTKQHCDDLLKEWGNSDREEED